MRRARVFLFLCWLLAAAFCAPGALAADAPRGSSREEALAAIQKAQAAIKASQAAIDAAAEAKRDDVVVKAKKLLAQNQQKLAEAEALLRAALAANDPMRDPLFVAAALDNARKDAEREFNMSVEAAVEAKYSPDRDLAERAAAEAWARCEKAQQTVRDLRTKKQELEHAQLMADMQRLRQDPALAAELDQVLRRVHDEELVRLKAVSEPDRTISAMNAELDRLKNSGAYRDTTELLALAKTDPRVRAALDRAHEAVMHNQADILRDSTDTLWQEVQRLKQKLPPAPPPAR